MTPEVTMCVICCKEGNIIVAAEGHLCSKHTPTKK